jgi:tetratricopeptide (TPR) repeat protein
LGEFKEVEELTWAGYAPSALKQIEIHLSQVSENFPSYLHLLHLRCICLSNLQSIKELIISSENLIKRSEVLKNTYYLIWGYIHTASCLFNDHEKLKKILEILQNLLLDNRNKMKNEDRLRFEGNLYYFYSMFYNARGNNIKGIESANQSIELFKIINDKIGMAEAYRFLGLNFFNFKKLEEAGKAYAKSKELFLERNNKYPYEFLLINIAWLYFWQGKDLEGINHYEEALSIAIDVQNTNRVVLLNIRLANRYAINYEREKATKHLEWAIKSITSISDLFSKYTTYQEIGDVFIRLGELEQANTYFQVSLEAAIQLDQINTIIWSKYNLYTTLTLQGKLEEALKRFLELLNYLEINKIKLSLFYRFVYISISEIYYKLGEKRKSENYLIKAKEIVGKENRLVSATYYSILLLRTQTLQDTNSISNLIEEILTFRNDNTKYDLLILLFNLLEEIGQLHILKEHLPKLESFNNLSSYNQHYTTYYTAIFFKESSRLKDKIKAQDIFETIFNESATEFDLRKKAFLHLCELILFEIKVMNDTSLIRQLKDMIINMINFSQEHHNYELLGDLVLQMFKLELIELNIFKAEEYFNQFVEIANKTNIVTFINKIEGERNILEKWKSFEKEETELEELLELSGVNESFKELIKKSTKVDPSTDMKRVQSYMEKAQRMVDVWEKE